MMTKLEKVHRSIMNLYSNLTYSTPRGLEDVSKVIIITCNYQNSEEFVYFKRVICFIVPQFIRKAVGRSKMVNRRSEKTCWK